MHHRCSLRLLFALWCALGCAQTQYAISTVAGGAPPATPAPAAGATIGSPWAVALDGAGNIYFASVNSVFKIDASGQLTRIAGNGRAGFSGDGGPATTAQLNQPFSLAFGGGYLYIGDSANNRVRRVASDGTISTVAGNGGFASFGDGGPAASAPLSGVSAVAVDAAGNLYIGGGNVRKVGLDGTIQLVANTPASGLAVDGTGNVFVAQDQTVSHVAANGTLTTLAVVQASGCLGDPIPINPQLAGMAIDAAGNLLVADEGADRVVSVTPSGSVTVVAGNLCNGTTNDGGPATNAAVYPAAVATDASGSFYIADRGNGKIRKVAANGTISTLAGNGGPFFSGDGGPATAALLSVGGIAADSAGNVYVSDSQTSRVRKIASNGTISTIAGIGTAGFSGDGGPASSAQLNVPAGIAVDSGGNVYVADYQNQRVRKISGGGTIATVAGSGVAGFSGDGGPATQANLNGPVSVAVDSSGNLWIADSGNNRVRKVSSQGTIATVVGNGQFGEGGNGGPAVNASIDMTVNIAVDTAANLYLAEYNEDRIRKVGTDGVINLFAGGGFTGSGSNGYGGDGGPATMSQISTPSGLAVDSSGNLFIADCGDNRVREVTPNGTIVTIAGNGTSGYFGDGSLAINGELRPCSGIAIDAEGNLYVGHNDASSNGAAIRALRASSTPLGVNVVNGASNMAAALAPGEIVVFYGSGLGPDPIVSAQNGVFGTQLGGVSVLFNGVAAPMIYSWTKQVAAVVPYELTNASTARVQIQYQGQTVFDQTAVVGPAAPALFTANTSGLGQAAALNQDGTINSPQNPAAAGSVIVLFATGEGQTTPGGVDGKLAAAPLPQPQQQVFAQIGGDYSPVVQYAGGAPGLVAGVLQVNVQIPATIKSGAAVPVQIAVGRNSTGYWSPGSVTIAVK
jgi:uncharacterized protein (TIGR03437 family)